MSMPAAATRRRPALVRCCSELRSSEVLFEARRTGNLVVLTATDNEEGLAGRELDCEPHYGFVDKADLLDVERAVMSYSRSLVRYYRAPSPTMTNGAQTAG